jgi:hypothetical protein
MPPKHHQHYTPPPKLAGNTYKALVDLRHDRSDPFTDKRDGKVDRTDERSTVNVLQCTSAAETTVATLPQQTLTRDPPLHIWHHELITTVIDTVIHDAPIDYGPPSPTIPMSSPSTMEEVSLQLYRVQQGIEDILDAVCNPAGKRKCSLNSEYDNNELQSPTTC